MKEARDNGTTTDAIKLIVDGNREVKKTKVPTFDEENEVTLEDLAPDGGWGWMIMLAMILILITTIGPTSSFGIIFGEFMKESGQEGMASSLFNSVFMITFSISSMMTNMLLKKYSVRPVGIMGALFFGIPDILLAFVRDIYEMAFLFFLQGFGLGLLITISNTVFNQYFVKKRAKVMSAAQVVIALGGIIYPTLTEKMMAAYGFRGTAAIVGALSLNSVVGMTMMHPIEWHIRKLEDVRAEKARERKQQSQALSKRRSTIDFAHLPLKTKWSSLRSLKEEYDKETPLIVNLKPSAHRVASISAIEGGIRIGGGGGRAKSGSIRGSLAKSISTISSSSLVNLASSVSALGDLWQRHLERKNREKQDIDIYEKREKKEKEDREKNEEKQEEIVESECKIILKELLDISLLKNLCFINLCFGVSFVCLSDYAFISLLPLMMTDKGYKTSDASLTITISGITELVSKILLAIFTVVVNVKSKYLFFGAMILMQFARIGYLLFENTLTGVLVMIGIIGLVRSWLMVPQPLVIIEDISIEKLASGYGIFSVIFGLVTLVFGAIVGLIKDWTNSFEMYQVSLLVMNGAFIIPWALQFIFVNLRKRRRRNDKLKKSATDLSLVF